MMRPLTPGQVQLVERLTAVAGCVLIILALAAVEWRLALGAAGFLLVLASLDIDGVRR